LGRKVVARLGESVDAIEVDVDDLV
jgi:hypothetical protein